jgi:hypothetical protein
VAFEQGFISAEDLARLGRLQGKSAYGQYLIRVAEEPVH